MKLHSVLTQFTEPSLGRFDGSACAEALCGLRLLRTNGRAGELSPDGDSVLQGSENVSPQRKDIAKEMRKDVFVWRPMRTTRHPHLHSR